MENKPLFKISLFNWWYVVITLIFILMKYLDMIDWGPLWILSPLWIPSFIGIVLMFIVYLLKILISITIFIYDRFKYKK